MTGMEAVGGTVSPKGGEVVHMARDGEVGIILIDNPPVNALGAAVRAGLAHALESLDSDPAIAAIVLGCAGRTFAAGADITEFGKPKQQPDLQAVVAAIESASKPVVAALHGTALGGGLELALACSWRIADSRAKLGLPEVKLGLIPGAGGTVRLPLLIGPRRALAMILSGNPVSAATAQADGLVDLVVEGVGGDDLIAQAVAFARSRLAEGGPWPSIRDRGPDRFETEREDLEADAAGYARKARGLDAPVAAVTAVRNALTLPFDAALAEERRLFEGLVAGEQSQAQRHLFFAERAAAHVPGVGKEVAPRTIGRVGVIGAGTMGGGIAMAFVNGGFAVTIVDLSREALDRGLATIVRNYATSVARGSLTEAEKDRRLARLEGATAFDSLAGCDLIIEAVFEDMAVKKEVFAHLDRVARPGAILATNTSYLDVNAIAASTGRPQDVVGLHFFSPANVMKLLEIVRAKETAPDVLVTALALAKRIGKIAVVVGVCHGFVGNRMLAARGAENEALLLEGASPTQIDRVFTDFGWPMGPFQMGDLAGLDIGWRNRKALGRTAPIADALCEQGRFGQKTGSGFYRYDAGSRTPVADPEVEQMILETAAAHGIARRAIPDAEIIERTLYPMINEGAKILEEGIAARESDIDLVWVNGYGFPLAKGGPMFWARHHRIANPARER
jgi:3-hydroxyacyl-CoA dehydrogenase